MKSILLFIAFSISCNYLGNVDASYSWKQAIPPGTGCHQDECVEGQWPMAITPLNAFDNKLWMVG